MKDENIDFFGYGISQAKDMYKNSKLIAEQIQEKYGTDARLQYECGLSIALATIEKNLAEKIEIKKDCIHSKIDRDENLINNSYLGKKGVSTKEVDEPLNQILREISKVYTYKRKEHK